MVSELVTVHHIAHKLRNRSTKKLNVYKTRTQPFPLHFSLKLNASISYFLLGPLTLLSAYLDNPASYIYLGLIWILINQIF